MYVDWKIVVVLVFFVVVVVDIKVKVVGCEVVSLCFKCIGKDFLDVVKCFDVCDGIWFGCFFDWWLINKYDIFDLIIVNYIVEGKWGSFVFVFLMVECVI